MKEATSKELRGVLMKLFARFRDPDELDSDDRLQFRAKELGVFYTDLASATG